MHIYAKSLTKKYMKWGENNLIKPPPKWDPVNTAHLVSQHQAFSPKGFCHTTAYQVTVPGTWFPGSAGAA